MIKKDYLYVYTQVQKYIQILFDQHPHQPELASPLCKLNDFCKITLLLIFTVFVISQIYTYISRPTLTDAFEVRKKHVREIYVYNSSKMIYIYRNITYHTSLDVSISYRIGTVQGLKVSRNSSQSERPTKACTTNKISPLITSSYLSEYITGKKLIYKQYHNSHLITQIAISNIICFFTSHIFNSKIKQKTSIFFRVFLLSSVGIPENTAEAYQFLQLATRLLVR